MQHNFSRHNARSQVGPPATKRRNFSVGWNREETEINGDRWERPRRSPAARRPEGRLFRRRRGRASRARAASTTPRCSNPGDTTPSAWGSLAPSRKVANPNPPIDPHVIACVRCDMRFRSKEASRSGSNLASFFFRLCWIGRSHET
jgi:hypothetical protein